MTSILVIEDNLADFRLVSEYFQEKDGAIVASNAPSLSSARHLLENTKFDAILLDLHLPDSAGIETFRQIHQLAPNTPIVVFTGYDDEALGEKLIVEGAQDFLCKSADTADTVAKRIKFAISRSSSRGKSDRRNEHPASKLNTKRIGEFVAKFESDKSSLSSRHDVVNAMLLNLKARVHNFDANDISDELSIINDELNAARRRHSDQFKRSAEMIQDLREELSAANTLARTDQLTGLANRRQFDEELSKVIASPDQHSVPTSLMLVDIDHFKSFNDKWGHQVGDEALCSVAGQLASVFSGKGVVSRYGGEEFAILLHNTAQSVAKGWAEIARHAIGSRKIGVNSDKSDMGNLSISIGLSFFQNGDTSDSLIERADSALYRAKTSGRDRVILAS